MSHCAMSLYVMWVVIHEIPVIRYTSGTWNISSYVGGFYILHGIYNYQLFMSL